MHSKRVDFFTSQIAHDWHAGVLLLHIYSTYIYMYLLKQRPTIPPFLASKTNCMREIGKMFCVILVQYTYFKARQLAKMNTHA